MKRKLLTVLLSLSAILCMCFAVAACDSQNNENPGDTLTGDHISDDDYDDDGQSQEGDDSEHIHNLTRHERTEPACTIAGNILYWSCSGCGKNYSDAEATQEVYETGIAALGHDYEPEITSQPTCTQDGVETFICTRCNDSYTQKIDALNHDIIKHDGWEATCTDGGWEAYETCSRCDYSTYKETKPLSHNYVNKVCTRCGDVYKNKWDGSVADAFEGGNGTEENPYLISTGAQLAYLASTVSAGNIYTDKYFALTDDIDLNNLEWTPIGNSTYYFNGTIYGSNYVISNLSITSCYDMAGLFYGLNSSSAIYDLGLENISINISYTNTPPQYAYYGYAGGLAGECTGKIINCYATGNIVACNYYYVGGIIGLGRNNFNIVQSHADVNITATVDAATPNYYSGAGGIAGSATNVTFNGCYSTGDVKLISTTSTMYAGGLAGNCDGSFVSYSYAFGDVEIESYAYDATSYAGGLVGSCSYEIFNSYSTGDVAVNMTASATAAYAGGFAGQVQDAYVANCFGAGNINVQAKGAPCGGGFVGLSSGSTTLFNCYRCEEQTYSITKTSTSLTPTNTEGKAAAREDLQSDKWIQENLWTIEADSWLFGDGYPELNYGYINDDSVVITISTLEEFSALQGNMLTKDYCLNADIDIGGINWTSIAYNSGKFMGNGHTISNLTIDDTTIYYVGLFGINNGEISRLALTDCKININYTKNPLFAYIGAFAGANGGSISDCYSTGDISAKTVRHLYSGGIVGTNDKNITNCYSTCNVDNLVTGTAIFFAYSGGIAGTGARYSSTISNCFATGNISAASGTANYAFAGGIAGYDALSTPGCYRYQEQEFLVESGTKVSHSATNEKGTSATLENLQSSEFQSQTLGWSEEIWNFTDGQFPTLKY